MAPRTQTDFDPDRFYSETTMGNLPDGNYEIVEEQMRILVRGTTITHAPHFKLRRCD